VIEMRVLVLGSGGREHAIAWRLRQDGSHVICAPGNGGIEKDARCLPLPLDDVPALLEAARHERIDLVVIGPEAPLAAGLADRLRAERIPVVGPSRAAARLESSKVFAKEFMTRHSIPTAAFSAHSTVADALKRLGSSETQYPLVIKADGLAAGKGVIVAHDELEARSAINRILVTREFGDAGDRLILEEFLPGREASFIVFTDGENIQPAVPAKDHKAVYDNDSGPNTGGMGAFSTDTILDETTRRIVMDQVIIPTVAGMKEEGSPFSGMLYAGLMLTPEGPRVLEFNVRMGDPEAQVILPRLQSSLTALFHAISVNALNNYRISWKTDAALCVVLVSEGYPGHYERGRAILGLEIAVEDPRIQVFHSGTRRRDGTLVTDGGRVLGVTAIAPELAGAAVAAYEAVNKIHFSGMHYRRDIGRSATGAGS
jgi:phosphoribosylamine---glycine ligase